MNYKKIIFKTFTIITLFASVCLGAESADDIIRKVDERQKSDSEVSELSMIVIDDISNLSDTKVFKLESFSRSDKESELSVFFFREPRRLSGMAILTRDDGQWVYFPSTGRVRLLSGAARGGSINGVGGDFSYEDLGSGDWGDKYSFSLKETNELKWILEGVPLDDEITYSRILMEVGRADYIPKRIEFYKSSSSPEKTLIVREVQSFNGRLNPSYIEMENPAKNSRTIIEIHNIEFDRRLGDNLFHPRQFYR